MKTLRLLIAPVIFSIALFSIPLQAGADEYDDSQSHPLRILGYLLHPIGVITEWTVTRPFHLLVSGTKTQEYIFGHNPHPPLFAEPKPIYGYGVTKREPQKQAPPPKQVASKEPVAEKIIVKEIIVEKPVIKEVPKIVEVERVVFPDIAFRFDSAQLTELGKGTVYLAAQRFKEKSNIVVVIEGHTDYIGSDEYNQKLGLRRAQTVMKELAQLGIDPERMSAASFGESKPLIEQQTDWARAVNRRVEFKVTTP
ncbi:MAG: OmpA family protein [Candidatus Binatia bacterium]